MCGNTYLSVTVILGIGTELGLMSSEKRGETWFLQNFQSPACRSDAPANLDEFVGQSDLLQVTGFCADG